MRDRQVEPLCLPTHSTTSYAALDVACFSPLSHAYQNERRGERKTELWGGAQMTNTKRPTVLTSVTKGRKNKNDG